MIRVVVVDDSALMREYLQIIINSDKDLKVVGVAKDGQEAIEMVQAKHPDVVTMDIHMPRLDGYEATIKIMQKCPVPIIIVSSDMDPGQVEDTFRALQVGAVAVLKKPEGPKDPNFDHVVAKFNTTLKLMSEVKVIRRRFGYKKSEAAPPILSKSKLSAASQIELVAIGASTGGPPVIKTILANMSKDFPHPILIVQHIAAGFLQGLVEWLSKETAFQIKIAAPGEHVTGGHVYFAPDDLHMGITNRGEIELSDSPPEKNLRPAVSYLFRSVIKAYGNRALGVLLTGMGKDGSLELKGMRDKGALTVVQDRESSIVHGMPGEAIKLGAADKILCPEEMAAFLNSLVDKYTEARNFQRFQGSSSFKLSWLARHSS